VHWERHDAVAIHGLRTGTSRHRGTRASTPGAFVRALASGEPTAAQHRLGRGVRAHGMSVLGFREAHVIWVLARSGHIKDSGEAPEKRGRRNVGARAGKGREGEETVEAVGGKGSQASDDGRVHAPRWMRETVQGNAMFFFSYLFFRGEGSSLVLVASYRRRNAGHSRFTAQGRIPLLPLPLCARVWASGN
jgi:hypothetical protein